MSIDKTTHAIFEVVGSYFTDTVFNHIWQSASDKIAAKSAGSVTEEYVRHLSAYLHGVKADKKCYEQVVHQLQRYFVSSTLYCADTFATFVDRIVGVCVPAEYFKDLGTQQKDEFLSSILCELVAELVAFASRPEMLRRIIDERASNTKATIRMIQDHAITALSTKRMTIRNLFLKKIGQTRDMVPVEIVESLKNALRKLVKEKAALAAELSEAQEAARRAGKRAQEAREESAKLRRLVAHLQAESPVAAVAAMRVPREDRTGEGRGGGGSEPPRQPPRRDRIAEPTSSEDDGSESPREHRREPAREPARAPARAPPLEAKKTIKGPITSLAGFFNSPAVTLPAAVATKPAPAAGASPLATAHSLEGLFRPRKANDED